MALQICTAQLNYVVGDMPGNARKIVNRVLLSSAVVAGRCIADMLNSLVSLAVVFGMGGLLALKAAERVAIGGLVLIGSHLPRDLRPAQLQTWWAELQQGVTHPASIAGSGAAPASRLTSWPPAPCPTRSPPARSRSR